jgi:hypothetical protein
VRQPHDLAEHVRSIEITAGQIMRRQSGIMESLRRIEASQERIEKIFEKHDRWERRLDTRNERSA